MPIYVYGCRGCGAEQEVSHRIDEPPPARCAACGGTLERVFTVPRLNRGNYSSAAAARYARMSPAEEVADARAALESGERAKREAPPGR